MQDAAALAEQVRLPAEERAVLTIATDAQAPVARAGELVLATAAHAASPDDPAWRAGRTAAMSGPLARDRLIHSHDRLLAGVLAGSWPEDMIRSGRYAHQPADMTGGPTPYLHAGWARSPLTE